MKQETIQATVPANEEKGTQEMSANLTVNFPETVEEAKAWCGEESLLTNAFANWRITLQSNIRAALRRGENQEQIQDRLGASKMGVATQGVKIDPVQAYLMKFQSATPEQQKAMLAELQERAKAS